MEEVPENSKKLSHSAHASGMNEQTALKVGLTRKRLCMSQSVRQISGDKIM
jgi:hypothetical protein